MSNKEKWMLIYHARGVVLTLCVAILLHVGLWLGGVYDKVLLTLFIPFVVLYLAFMFFDRMLVSKNPQLEVLTQENRKTLGFKVDSVVMLVAVIAAVVSLFLLRNSFNIVLLIFAIYYIVSTVIYSIGVFRKK